MNITFQTHKTTLNISVEPNQGNWLLQLLNDINIEKGSPFTIAQIKEKYTAAGLEGFELFWDNKPITSLYKAGLLLV